MITIAVGLVHNKSDANNQKQIQDILPLVEKHTDLEGNLLFYSLSGMAMEHQAIFFQVIPFGVTPPVNLYALDSYKVFYGKGDEDKTGEHARFFNWLFKRGTDYGAEVVAYVRSPEMLGTKDFEKQLSRINSKRVLIDASWGHLAHVHLLRTLRSHGEETLDETKRHDAAMIHLKSRLSNHELEHE